MLAKETMVFNGDPTLLGKLKDVGVELQTISPTDRLRHDVHLADQRRHDLAAGTTGAVNSSGGLKLVQNLPTRRAAISTSITLANIGVDLGGENRRRRSDR